MIRLVASDIDGTLIPYGENRLSDEIFDQIRALKEKGIAFAVASGRQLASMQHVFAPVAEDVYYITENGAIVFDGKEQVLSKTPMDTELVKAIANDFYHNSDGEGEVMISGNNMVYLLSRDKGMAKWCANMRYRFQIIQSVDEIPEPIIKLAGFFNVGSDKFADRFVDKWKVANCAISGPWWIDAMIADKGVGTTALCKALGISNDEVMAFGDNYNDVPMLDVVGMPYIMDASQPALLAKYPLHTSRPEVVLRSLLAE